MKVPESMALRRTFMSLFQVEALDSLEELNWKVLACCPASSHGRKDASELEAQGEGVNYFLMRTKIPKGGAIKSSPLASSACTEKENPLQHDSAGEENSSQNLPLPEVIQKLVKENDVLRWDSVQKCYQVLDGERFKGGALHGLSTILTTGCRSFQPAARDPTEAQGRSGGEAV
eukprot:747117-Hanusia_phi.AAC.4